MEASDSFIIALKTAILLIASSLLGSQAAPLQDPGGEFSLARDYFRTGRFAECLRILEREPESRWNAEAFNMIAGSLARLGRTGEAERTFRGAISRYPQHLAAYYNLAQLLMERQSHDRAIAVLKDGLQVFPRSDRLLRALGTAYQASGHFQDAQAAFQRWVELSPAADEPYAMLGDSYLESGEYGLALASLRKAEERNPRSPRIQYLLGLAHSYLGHVADSQICLRRAIELDPGFCLAYDQLAKGELDGGNLTLALDLLKKATECDPNLAQPHYQLSRIYSRRGESALAEEEMRLFLKLRLPARQGKGNALGMRP